MNDFQITKKNIITINQEIGEQGEFVNESSLDFALSVANVKRNWLYEVSYIVRSLLVDHAFRDGNKRTSLIIITLYLDHYHQEYNPEQLVAAVTKIARGKSKDPVSIVRLLYHGIKRKNS